MKITENTVCICLAAYNGEKYIKAQIDSILGQTWRDIHLFIRDDGSSDGTGDIIRALAAKDPDRITVICDPSLAGGGAKENFSAILSYVDARYTFSWYMFSDQDDVWFPDKIDRSMEAMSKLHTDGPALVHTDLVVTDASLNVLGESFFQYRALDVKKQDLNHLLIENNMTGCTMLWNRALEKIVSGTFGGAALHDWWMSLAAASFGRIGCVMAPEICYRQHGSNTVGATKVNTPSFILERLRGRTHVRETLQVAEKQAQSFLNVFYNRLSGKQRQVLLSFIQIPLKSKPGRIFAAFRGGFLKQGIVQIIGEMLFI